MQDGQGRSVTPGAARARVPCTAGALNRARRCLLAPIALCPGTYLQHCFSSLSIPLMFSLLLAIEGALNRLNGVSAV